MSELVGVAAEGDLEGLQELLRQGVDSDSKEQALQVAASQGQLEIARYLAEEGVDVDSTNCDDWTALMAAAAGGHLELVQFLAGECGADVNAIGNGAETALTLAAGDGHVEVVRYLAGDCGVDVNAKDALREAAVLHAARNGHLEVVWCLVEFGADVNVTGNDGDTALMRAARHGHLDIVRYLAGQHGVNDSAQYTALAFAAREGHVDVGDGGADVSWATDPAATGVVGTVLLGAARSGHLDIVRYLIGECRADVNAKDKHGETALVAAAGEGHLEVVRYLADCGAGVSVANKTGASGLTKAARRGHLDVVRFLAGECRAYVNGTTNDGETALMAAAGEGHLEVVRYLAGECGADVNATSSTGSTGLIGAARCGNLGIVQYLAGECKADVHCKDNVGETALMSAAGGGHLEIVRYLTGDCGANVNDEDSSGDTALVFAASGGHVEVVRYLVGACGAAVNPRETREFTALMHAAVNGHFAVVQYLAGECGADVNTTSKDGYTALTLAVEYGYTDVIQFLARDCSADVNTKTKDGNTVLIWAAGRGVTDFVRYLVKKCGANVNAMNNDGYSALGMAIEHGYSETIEVLVRDCGADVNTKSKGGKTTLMWAVEQGLVDFVRYLVNERKADVSARTLSGVTALQLASDRGYIEIQRILTPSLSRPQTCISPKTAESVRSSCTIPPFEIELVRFAPRMNIGGEFVAKWLDADVVVKLAIQGDVHEAFDKETRLWQRLCHPNVLKLYGACYTSPQLQFFVCEYASNGSLLEYVEAHASTKKRPTGSRSSMWKLLYDAALGLGYLHEQRVVHGDLRCSNILIGSDGLAKLSNFALSSVLEGRKSSDLGFMRWQAPEVLVGDKPSFESDVYSLGMCILEAVTRRKPWVGKNEGVVWKYKQEWVPESSKGSYTYEPYCPIGGARNLVWRMCCNSPDERLQLSSVIVELENLAATEQHEQEPACSFTDYNGGALKELWLQTQTQMQGCHNSQCRLAFTELQSVHELLQRSSLQPAILSRFRALLSEFYPMIQMTELVRVVQLSSTRASNRFRALHWRIDSLLTVLGGSVGTANERQQRWEKQRREQTELFVSSVSNSSALLQELRSMEERSAFLKLLKTEMGSATSRYTSDQIDVVKKSYESIAGNIEGGDLTKLTPEWFIPWYELTDGGYLGTGGLGRVYRAKWLDSDVVVKQLYSGESDQRLSYQSLSASLFSTTSDWGSRKDERLATLRREIDSWFRLSHPHITKLFGACHVGSPFVVCENAPNGTLVEYLRKHPDELWTKVHEAALGVQYLHARNVVHGDLKGNNIVIGSDLKAKVTDVGLSSIPNSAETAPISGAFNWAAPECIIDTDARPTFAADVYSLGMCIIEALRVVEAVRCGGDSTNCLPWLVRDHAAHRYHATNGELPSRPRSCEANVWDLIKRMCVLDPEKRVKMSTVVDEFNQLASLTVKDSGNGVTSSKLVRTSLNVPEVIASSRQELCHLQSGSRSLPYQLLWDGLQHLYAQLVDSGKHDECNEAFCELLTAARECTLRLQHPPRGLVAITEMTVQCYTLLRRVSTFCDRHGFMCEQRRPEA